MYILCIDFFLGFFLHLSVALEYIQVLNNVHFDINCSTRVLCTLSFISSVFYYSIYYTGFNVVPYLLQDALPSTRYQYRYISLIVFL